MIPRPTYRPAIARSLSHDLLRRGLSIALALVGGALAVEGVLRLVLFSRAPSWASRTAAEWEPLLHAASAAQRDSAMVAVAYLEPRHARTLRAAAALLADDDPYVRRGAFRALVGASAAHDVSSRPWPMGGVARSDALRHDSVHRQVLAVTRVTLHGVSPLGRTHAAEVLGALGRGAASETMSIVARTTDRESAVREAAVIALGRILEAARVDIDVDGATRSRGVLALVTATSDASPQIRDAALDALFRVAPDDPRLATVLRVARCDVSRDVRERAESQWALLGETRARRSQPTPPGPADAPDPGSRDLPRISCPP